MATVVIVDDSKEIKTKWKRVLRRENIEVIDAVNSRQLFDILLKETVDLIILELFLSYEHGYHIIRRLKEDPYYCNIPIMVVSTERRRISIQEVINAGINDYLIKPVDIDLFLKRVKRLLQFKECQRVS